VKRKAIKISESADHKKAIYVDKQNAEKIYHYINQDKRHKNKFRHITHIILEGLRNTELYDKEDIDKKSKGVTAMKFFKGQENDRIYCKEITTENKTFVVIACELHQKKKSKGISHKEKNIIHNVAEYEYELE